VTYTEQATDQRLRTAPVLVFLTKRDATGCLCPTCGPAYILTHAQHLHWQTNILPAGITVTLTEHIFSW